MLHFITDIESSTANRETSDENDTGVLIALGALLAIAAIILVISLTANVIWIIRRKQGRL